MDQTVCIIEDDADMRDVLARIVRSVGLTPEFCASVNAFLHRHDKSKIGCLLIDNQPGGMSDGALLEKLGEARANIPVFLISGAHDAVVTASAQHVRAVIFGKPFDARLLARRIHTAIRAAES